MREVLLTVRLRVPEGTEDSALKEEIEQAFFNHLDVEDFEADQAVLDSIYGGDDDYPTGEDYYE